MRNSRQQRAVRQVHRDDEEDGEGLESARLVEGEGADGGQVEEEEADHQADRERNWRSVVKCCTRSAG